MILRLETRIFRGFQDERYVDTKNQYLKYRSWWYQVLLTYETFKYSCLKLNILLVLLLFTYMVIFLVIELLLDNSNQLWFTIWQFYHARSLFVYYYSKAYIIFIPEMEVKHGRKLQPLFIKLLSQTYRRTVSE